MSSKGQIPNSNKKGTINIEIYNRGKKLLGKTIEEINGELRNKEPVSRGRGWAESGLINFVVGLVVGWLFRK